ncbi:hypothetical protein FKP32DRAFT_1235785 [Trametes sanguinea]|nr:hypothetical protein FKP32DRAFT_1235785 [Trametes sanguinea]
MMKQRYLGEFFDGSSRLGCVWKPSSTPFQRAPLRQDTPPRSCAITHTIPLVNLCASLRHSSTTTRPIRTRPSSFGSPSRGLSNKPLRVPNGLVVVALQRQDRPLPPHHYPLTFYSSYLLIPWTVSGHLGLTSIASTSSMSSFLYPGTSLPYCPLIHLSWECRPPLLPSYSSFDTVNTVYRRTCAAPPWDNLLRGHAVMDIPLLRASLDCHVGPGPSLGVGQGCIPDTVRVGLG